MDKTAPITVPMNYTRETKNTFIFATTDETAPIETIYVKKRAFDKAPPKRITLTIAAATEGDS